MSKKIPATPGWYPIWIDYEGFGVTQLEIVGGKMHFLCRGLTPIKLCEGNNVWYGPVIASAHKQDIEFVDD